MHSPLFGFQAVVDTVLESSASALSNAVSTSIQKATQWQVIGVRKPQDGTSATVPITGNLQSLNPSQVIA